jgi:CRISPR-associated protein Csx14
MRFREIFVFVAGATPQIITETIYALAHKNPPIYPDEICIITTTVGKRLIEETLLRKDILGKMVEELELPEITLDESSFVVVKNEDDLIDDIRNGLENETLGNIMTEIIKEKAEDFRVRLHCSLAGGRKTMGFYLGAALQLFGRPWDKLYHVLVTPEFESNPAFYYKPKKDVFIDVRTPDGEVRKLSTEKAEIILADLPFIRLRNKLSLSGKGFKEMVLEGQKEIDMAIIQSEIKVSLSERMVWIKDYAIEMTPIQLMFYITFLRQKVNYCEHSDREYCFECRDCFKTVVELSNKDLVRYMAKDYKEIYQDKPFKDEELLRKWKDGIGMDVIRQNISKINSVIKRGLTEEILLPYYLITNVKKYGTTKYGIGVEKSKIRIE